MITNSDQITHNKVDIFLDDKHGGDLSYAVRVNRKIKKWIDLSTGIETRINLKLDILLMLSFESIIPSSVAILKLSLEISNPKISVFGNSSFIPYENEPPINPKPIIPIFILTFFLLQ